MDEGKWKETIQSTFSPFEISAKTFSCPKTSSAYQKTKDEIILFAEEFQLELTDEKHRIYLLQHVKKLLKILEDNAVHNEKVHINFVRLEALEKEVRDLECGTTVPKSALKSLKKQISSVSSLDEELLFEKNMLAKRVSLLEDTLRSQKHPLEQISEHIRDLQAVPRPFSGVRYTKKRGKIVALMRQLAPADTQCVEEILHNLETLDRNAVTYEELVQCLELLERTGVDILTIAKSPLSEKRKFEELRSLQNTLMNCFDHFNVSLRLKKREVLDRLPPHMFDRSQFDQEEYDVVVRLLGECTRQIRSFAHPTSSVTYRKRKVHIEEMTACIVQLSKKNVIIEGDKDKFLNDLQQLFELLDQKAREVNDSNRDFKLLERISNDLDRVLDSDQTLEAKLDVVFGCEHTIILMRGRSEEVQIEIAELLNKIHNITCVLTD